MKDNLSQILIILYKNIHFLPSSLPLFKNVTRVILPS